MIYERRHTRDDRRLRRHRERRADVRGVLTIVALSSIGAAGHERLRRRVPRAGRLVPDVSGADGRRGDRRDPRRGVPALGDPADLFNPLDKPENEHFPDLNWRELGLLVPLVAAIIWLGVYPKPVLAAWSRGRRSSCSTVRDARGDARRRGRDAGGR